MLDPIAPYAGHVETPQDLWRALHEYHACYWLYGNENPDIDLAFDLWADRFRLWPGFDSAGANEPVYLGG